MSAVRRPRCRNSSRRRPSTAGTRSGTACPRSWRRWSEKAEDELLRARESLTAVTAPLAVRAELRGRLDAYKAKVARHGFAEDPFLVERYDAARRMLWSAPCDLRVAEQAVLRYQRAAAEVLGPAVPEQGGPRDRAEHGGPDA